MHLLLIPPTLAVLDLTPLKGMEATVEGRRKGWDLLQAASALQGIVNRKEPRLYVRFVGDEGKIDRYWLARLRKTWMKGWTLDAVKGVEGAIRRFRGDVKGLVVWDERVPATANVATTAAGVEDLIPVRDDPAPDSLYSRLSKSLPVRLRIPHFDGKRKGSAKCDAYLWAAERYLVPGRCAPGWLAYYPDAAWIADPKGVPLERTLLSNADFFVSKRGFAFDLGPWDDEAPDDDKGQRPGTDASTLETILRRAYGLNGGRMTHVGGFTPWDQKYTRFTGGKHGEVDTEWRYAQILSGFNAFMDADAPGLHAMANASVYGHEPLRAVYPQRLPTVDDLRAKGYVVGDRVVPRAYAAVYVGDYDSAAWLYQTLPERWDDPARGTIPLGWAFDPILAARFPTGLVYARETATPNDSFIAGDSGAGYLNPGGLQAPRASGLASGVAEWERFCAPLYRQWGLGITGFVIDGFAPAMDDATKAAYARFSPQGVVAQKVPPISMVGGTPFLRMGSDLPRDGEAAARIVADAAPKAGFAVFRTILWTPTEHARLFARVRELRPDVEFVDPYTLMLLARLSQTRQGVAQGRR